LRTRKKQVFSVVCFIFSRSYFQNRLSSRPDCSFVQTTPYYFNNFYGNFATFKQKFKVASAAEIMGLFIDSFVQATSMFLFH
jgi:hypothetical protein